MDILSGMYPPFLSGMYPPVLYNGCTRSPFVVTKASRKPPNNKSETKKTRKTRKA